MSKQTPEMAVAEFVEAINRADLACALQCYEESAVFVAQPGVVVSGHEGIREALGEMLALRPRIHTESFEVIRNDDVALYHSSWRMVGRSGEGDEVSEVGMSADILRRQPNGEWRIAIDNPWGTGVL